MEVLRNKKKWRKEWRWFFEIYIYLRIFVWVCGWVKDNNEHRNGTKSVEGSDRKGILPYRHFLIPQWRHLCYFHSTLRVFKMGIEREKENEVNNIGSSSPARDVSSNTAEGGVLWRVEIQEIHIYIHIDIHVYVCICVLCYSIPYGLFVAHHFGDWCREGGVYSTYSVTAAWQPCKQCMHSKRRTYNTTRDEQCM